MKLSPEDTLELLNGLIWDYDISPDNLARLLDGQIERVGGLDRDALFVRCLERLPWHYVVALWGIETMQELYSSQNRNRLWPPERRESLDVAFAILRGDSLSISGWGSKRSKVLRNTFLSNRWNRPQPRILQT
jgi:hypothetical protein